MSTAQDRKGSFWAKLLGFLGGALTIAGWYFVPSLNLFGEAKISGTYVHHQENHTHIYPSPTEPKDVIQRQAMKPVEPTLALPTPVVDMNLATPPAPKLPIAQIWTLPNGRTFKDHGHGWTAVPDGRKWSYRCKDCGKELHKDAQHFQPVGILAQ